VDWALDKDEVSFFSIIMHSSWKVGLDKWLGPVGTGWGRTNGTV